MTGSGVFAQDATPTPGTSTTTEATEPETVERNAFLDAFAAQLGVTDQATIDAAIQATVTQLLDEKVAAGELSQAQADEILARIEAGDVPFGKGGFFGDHHGDKRDGHDKSDRDGEQNDDENQSNEDSTDDSTIPAGESTPAASTVVFA